MIHAIAQATGLARVVEWIGYGKCGGCQRRREKLNRLIPFRHDEEVLCSGLPARAELHAPVRNLLMFIEPLSEWRWDVEQIKRHLHLFNGKRIVAVATDERSVLDAVKGAFEGGGDIMWITADHEAALPLMLECVRSCHLRHITFCCHATGAQEYGDCLDMPFVEKQLETYTSLHFGDFSWFRNARLFSRPDWRRWHR